MQFLSVIRPPFSCEEAAALARDIYGLEGKMSEFESERDRNFLVQTVDGPAWIVKLFNRQEPEGVVEAQAAALRHIEAVDPTLPCPRLLRTRDGTATAQVTDTAGHVYRMFAVSYLPGSVVGDRLLDAGQLRALGALTARLSRALRGFVSGAPGNRELIWDNRHAPKLLAQVGHLPTEEQRRAARAILERFGAEAVPKLDRVRAQIIHGDVHPYNVLTGGDGAFSGIIDFGDLVHGALVQDLANVVADFLRPEQDIAATAGAIVSGYHGITALEEDELDVLVDLIEVRLLLTPLINAARAAQGQLPNDSLSDLGGRSLPLIARVQSGRASLDRAMREAAGHAAKADPPDVADMLKRRHGVMGPRMQLFYDPPLHIVRGQGVWLWASNGRRYLDCYNNVPHVGHCHPRVAEAIARQARVLNTNTRYLTDQALEYAERLTATAPPGLSAVAYVNSGSEANDVAWRMARVVTGNSGGLCMELAYHGITEASNAFSPSNAPHLPLAPHIRTLTAPDDYRGPHRRGEKDLAERYAALADEQISSLQQAGLGVCAAIVDSAFMTNGMLEAPKGYVQSVAERVRAAGGLFIADEVQSGFGRMGSAMWGHMHHGIVPDFITIGKPAGNGHPLGVVITTPEIFETFTKRISFFSTFGGNNVSCAAGIAMLDVIRDEDIVANARDTGAYLKTGLKKLMTKHRLIGDVRGTGLALGVELVRDRETLEPAESETRRLLNLIRDEGVLVGSEGRFGNILKIRPPAVIKPAEADIAVAAIDRALARL